MAQSRCHCSDGANNFRYCQIKSLFVMLVDDDTSLLSELLEAMKRKIDMTIVAFSSSIRAKEFMESNFIDALISDFDMPNCNGIELADAVELIHPKAKIIIMSGKEVRDINWNMAWHFLHKPFHPDEVIELISR